MPLSGDDHRRFLLRALAWPVDESSPGYVNIHWLTPSPRDATKFMWVGKPTKTVDDFMAMTKWVAGLPKVTDIYMCMSTQRQHGLSKSQKPKAIKLQANAISLKSIWLDVDVKDPPKGYKDISEALDAVFAFCAAAGLPKPSALVASGGGLHVYWISDRALMPAEWQGYANGLKVLAIQHGLRCDAGVTIDSARVLRVPGTQNFKSNPPKPVNLLHLADSDLDFDATIKFLTALAPAPVSTAMDLSAFAGEKPSAVFANLDPKTDSLTRGMEREDILLAPLPIMKECAFLRDALMTGGKDYSQPMWNLTTLAATWMENGHELAHKMGKGHPGYTAETTDSLWERKTRERKERGLGWPSCSAIQASGCTACGTCPLLALNKSPLNITPPAPTVSPTPVTAAVTNILRDVGLPDGYIYNSKGYLCKVLEISDKKGEAPPETIELPLFQCQISKMSASKQGDQDSLEFTVSRDLGNFSHVSLPMEKMNPFELVKSLLKLGVKYVPRNKQYLEDALMAIITKLHEAMESTPTVPFGWYQPGDTIEGFVYGGVIHLSSGGTHPSGYGDAKLRNRFQPRGSIRPWYDACKLITDQQRPGIEVLTAASFGAPLMKFAGQNAALLCIYGDSGAKKSAAIAAGLAVWGSPKTTKAQTATTENSAMQQMGETRNLPYYWDEVTTDKVRQYVYNMILPSTEGSEKGRLFADGTQRPRGEWQTIVISSGNQAIGDMVANKSRSTSAQLLRILEYKVFKPDDNAPGQIATHAAAMVFQELETNYGMMGMHYSQLLSKDHPRIKELVKKVIEDFSAKVDAQSDERFWVVGSACTIVGAMLANELGCQFHVEEITEYLAVAFLENRERRASESLDGGTVDNTDSIINKYFNDCYDATVFTDAMLDKAGRTAAVTLIKKCLSEREAPRVHVAVEDRMIRFEKRHFSDWAAANDVSAREVVNGLKQHYKAFEKRGTIGGGSPCHAALQTNLVNIPVPANSSSPFESFLLTHASSTDMGAAAAGGTP